jgi:COMPASS component SPP1
MAEMEATADASHVNGSAATKSTTNPYETNPDRIPSDDPFLSQSAQYGRYTPRADDFTPRFMNWYRSDPAVNAFWEKVAQQYCTPEYSLNLSGPREAFAAGSIIIRVDRELADGAAAERYSSANANELLAAQKAEERLRELGVAVPVVYFCGTIEGRNVTSRASRWKLHGGTSIRSRSTFSKTSVARFSNGSEQSILPQTNRPMYAVNSIPKTRPPSNLANEISYSQTNPRRNYYR